MLKLTTCTESGFRSSGRDGPPGPQHGSNNHVPGNCFRSSVKAGPHLAVNHVPGNGFRSSVRAGPHLAVNHVSVNGFRSSVRAGPHLTVNHVPGNGFRSSVRAGPHLAVNHVPGNGFRSSVRAGPHLAHWQLTTCPEMVLGPHCELCLTWKLTTYSRLVRCTLKTGQTFPKVTIFWCWIYKMNKNFPPYKIWKKIWNSPDGKWIRRMKCEGDKSSGLIDLYILFNFTHTLHFYSCKLPYLPTNKALKYLIYERYCST
jgi:hypothetical protein